MLRHEIEQVKDIAREIAKEEIAKALAEYVPPVPVTPAKIHTPKPAVEEKKKEDKKNG